MELSFENILYSDKGLEKPKGTVSQGSKSNYPGLEELESFGCERRYIKYISKDSSNISAFSHSNELKNGEPVFAIIENDDGYSLYCYRYSDNSLRPMNGERKELKNISSTGRFSIPKYDLEKPDCKGSKEEINEEIKKHIPNGR